MGGATLILFSFAALLAASPQARSPSRSAAPAAPLRTAADGPVAQQLAADSADLHRRARSAQERFEWLRTRSLRWSWDVPAPCDEVVGRFCLTHGDDPPPTPPPETPEVRAARDELLRVLAQVAAAIPGDGWVAGQRVRYLVEAGRPDAALHAAAECRAVSGWCPALVGYAYHAGGLVARAEAAFTEALRSLPEKERCAWTDISLFLRGDIREAYRELPCREREEIERRFWWLADPLWSEPGNDRRVEHLARHVLDSLQEQARSPYGVAWGADLRELLLRYGWPGSWERRPGSRADLASEPGIASHDPPRIRRFLPPPEALTDPAGIERGEWLLRPEAPFSGYAPRLAAFQELDHQVARFRRADSLVVVAAYELEADSGWTSGSERAVLFLAPVGDGRQRLAEVTGMAEVARVAADSGTRTLRAALPVRKAVLGLEVLSRADRRVARARYGIGLEPLGPFALGISDLLVTDPADSPPGTLEEAARRARGALRAEAPGSLALYWEVYGLGSGGETVDVAVTISRPGGGWLAALGRAIGMGRREPAVTLEWREAIPAGRRSWGRGVDVDLPALERGEYILRVEVRSAGREPARAERRITVSPARRARSYVAPGAVRSGSSTEVVPRPRSCAGRALASRRHPCARPSPACRPASGCVSFCWPAFSPLLLAPATTAQEPGLVAAGTAGRGARARRRSGSVQFRSAIRSASASSSSRSARRNGRPPRITAETRRVFRMSSSGSASSRTRSASFPRSTVPRSGSCR